MTRMIDTGINNHGVDNSGVSIPANKLGTAGAGTPPVQDKLPPGATKKSVLRDVQNQNGGLARNHQENFSFLEGGLSTDAVKVCGNKRLTPERPVNSSFYPALSNSCANEQIMNARRRFELELGKGSIHSKVNKTFECPQTRQLHHLQSETPQKEAHPRTSNSYCEPVATANNVVAPITNSFAGPSAPNFLGEYGPGMQDARTNPLKVNLECPSYFTFKAANEEEWTERYACLHKFLKECDESNCRDYVQRLQHLSPAELSRNAVELEKRAIQLTIEEGKEMHRMKALNVLGKYVVQ